ncbi:transmembrane protein 272 isoform X2 [Salmo salar]|uniref:Transmembrane protein 272 isoform X2 n=1 Tax=Salmo salar TaxID=8030 RepID=A0ABM3D3A3_SALSA|nr:transmembrane protein 272-like isoform X2 [Salmo salar]
MAAPQAGQPVSVTVGVVWKLKLDPPPPQPPRLTGVMYRNDCPQQPYIPSYLQGMAIFNLIMTTWMSFPWDPEGRGQQTPKSCICVSLQLWLALSGFCWIIAGNVWIFSIYQPNYDPTRSDGQYCNKTLYTFAFWNAVLENLALGAMLANCCKGLFCGILLNGQPQPDRDFHRNV